MPSWSGQGQLLHLAFTVWIRVALLRVSMIMMFERVSAAMHNAL